MLEFERLGFTTDKHGARSRSFPRVYSAGHRLCSLLRRCSLFSYFDVYGEKKTLFLQEVREDLRYELTDLKTTDIFKESMCPHEEHANCKVYSDSIDVILRLCEFLLGDTKYPPVIPSNTIDRLINKGSGCAWYSYADISSFIKYKLYAASVRAGDKVEPSITLKCIRLGSYNNGLSKSVCDFNMTNEDNSVMTFKVTQEDVTSFTGPGLLKSDTLAYHIKVFKNTDKDIDNLLSSLAGVCTEHDKNIVQEWFSDVDVTDTTTVLAFCSEFYTYREKGRPSIIQGRVRAYIKEYFQGWCSEETTFSMFLNVLSRIYGDTKLPLGPITSRLFKYVKESAAENNWYSNTQTNIAIKYFEDILTNPESKDTSKGVEAFKATFDCRASLDVKSNKFVSVASKYAVMSAELPELDLEAEAPKDHEKDLPKLDLDKDPPKDHEDKTKPKDVPTLDMDKDPPKDHPDDPKDTTKPEDQQLDVGDKPPQDHDTPPTDSTTPTEGDGTQTPMDDLGASTDGTDTTPVDPPKPEKPKKVYEFTIPDKETLSSFLYRKEVVYLIDEVTKIDPPIITAEEITLLKKLKTQWLFMLSVDNIDTILNSIIKFPVKTKAVLPV